MVRKNLERRIMTNQQKLIDEFAEKAQAVSTEVRVVEAMTEVLDYAVALCRDKEACQVLASGCEHPLSEPAEELCGLKQWQKLIAAPAMDQKHLDVLTPMCREAGIGLIQKGLAGYAGGIDVGLTGADLGISNTGTIVLNCPDEDLRLATMISEVHIAVLRAEDIYADSYDAEAALLGLFSAAPDYAAFITGPSRTADIERVLSLGVHGPLEMHVLILGQSEKG